MRQNTEYDIRYLKTDDLEQYDSLLRYAFQITEQDLALSGWRGDEIKQSKFPILERADVLGCFDRDTLVSQIAVYPLKMNVYNAIMRSIRWGLLPAYAPIQDTQGMD